MKNILIAMIFSLGSSAFASGQISLSSDTSLYLISQIGNSGQPSEISIRAYISETKANEFSYLLLTPVGRDASSVGHDEIENLFNELVSLGLTTHYVSAGSSYEELEATVACDQYGTCSVELP